MALQCGIVGLPNVGKSSLFNAMTEAAVAAENYPFCTIEPNVGVVPVPDARLGRIAAVSKSKSIVPATLRLVDIAGLVSGASKGEGLGNKFLAHIREVDGIVHVLRCFEDEEVSHVSGTVDPVGDARTVETELALSDLATLERAKDRLTRLARSGDKKAKKSVETIEAVARELDDGQPVRAQKLDGGQREDLAELCLLTDKPVLYCANISDTDDPSSSPLYDKVREYARSAGSGAMAVSARLEAELVGLDKAARMELLEAMGQTQTGLERLVRAAYALLGLGTFFTSGPKETRAWEFRVGIGAAEAAGLIHTDMSRGFVRAETVACEDFIKLGGEAGCREAGKLRLEGRDYKVRDGDVLHFRFNV